MLFKPNFAAEGEGGVEEVQEGRLCSVCGAKNSNLCIFSRQWLHYYRILLIKEEYIQIRS